jgi:hypothetical protein
VEGHVDEVEDEAASGGRPLMSRAELEKREHDLVHTILLKDKERKEKDEKERKHGKGFGTWFKK